MSQVKTFEPKHQFHEYVATPPLVRSVIKTEVARRCIVVLVASVLPSGEAPVGSQATELAAGVTELLNDLVVAMEVQLDAPLLVA